MWHDPEGRLDKAVARYDEGDLRTARTMLRGLDRRGVISPRIDLYLGHCHLGEDEIPAAIRRYRRCVALSPDDPSPWVGLGLCYGRLGRVHRAIKAFEHALKRNPNVEDAHCNLTHCYALLGDMERATRHARHVVRLDPRCPHVHRHMALAYLIRGDAGQSLRAWRRVRALDPTYAELPGGMGRALLDLSRFREAREAFRLGLEGELASDAHFGLGDVARVRGEWETALTHYEQAARAESGFVEARYRWAEALLVVGLPEDALRLLRTSLRHRSAAHPLEPLPASHALLYARAQAASGDSVAGLRTLRYEAHLAGQNSSGSHAGANTETWIDLGEYLFDHDRLHVARRLLRAACKRDTGSIRAWRLLSRIEARLGSSRDARKILSRACFRWPEEPELMLDLSAAHYAAGRTTAAERALLWGLERCPVSADLWAAVGEMALERDDLDTAAIRIFVSLRCDPRHPLALGLLARFHMASGSALRAANAGRAAQRVVMPGDAALAVYAQALLALDRWHDALVVLRRYVLDAPSDPKGYLLLAQCQEREGNPGAAATQRRLARVVSKVV